MQTDAEVAAIATQLSDKQRAALLATTDRWQTAKEIGVRGRTINSLRFLWRKGVDPMDSPPVCLMHRDYMDDPLRYIYRLSAAGIRVAQHLKQENAK